MASDSFHVSFPGDEAQHLKDLAKDQNTSVQQVIRNRLKAHQDLQQLNNRLTQVAVEIDAVRLLLEHIVVDVVPEAQKPERQKLVAEINHRLEAFSSSLTP